MDFIELHESLTDYFVRLEHGIEVARIRAAAVVNIVKAHVVEPVCILGPICVHRMPQGDDHHKVMAARRAAPRGVAPPRPWRAACG
jgi:hypothetical protein